MGYTEYSKKQLNLKQRYLEIKQALPQTISPNQVNDLSHGIVTVTTSPTQFAITGSQGYAEFQNLGTDTIELGLLIDSVFTPILALKENEYGILKLASDSPVAQVATGESQLVYRIHADAVIGSLLRGIGIDIIGTTFQVW